LSIATVEKLNIRKFAGLICSISFLIFYIQTLGGIYKFNLVDSCGENGLDVSSGIKTLKVVNASPAKQVMIANIPDIPCH